MIDLLQNLFNKFSLEDIDSLKETIESQMYHEFIQLYPNLESILSVGYKKDALEFNRTMKHVFRTIKVYILLHDQKLQYPGFSNQSTERILVKIKRINAFNHNLLPLILVYHDIGKFVRKRDHPVQSFNLISEMDLLNPFKLDENLNLLIKKVIQYHVLFATIYTGESTYYGTYSLIKDKNLVDLIINSNFLNMFVDCLEVFTYIDILGYSYSQIFDHYLNYYEKINNNLKDIFSRILESDSALNRALRLSQSWIKWRIAGALRIFQFVSTQPYLTEDFYYDRLKSSLSTLPSELNGLDWDNLITEMLKESCKIQIKYGLAFLMILAFGSFHRATMSENAEISSNLIYFWLLLTREVKKRSKKDFNGIWNVYILGIKNWFSIQPQAFKIVNPSFIQDIIKNSISSFDETLNEYTLNLDLSNLEKAIIDDK